MPAAAAGGGMSRAAYLARLRRAFLLRVHPDRFRNHPAAVRARQASLVRALADRLAAPDFKAWQQRQGVRHGAAAPTGGLPRGSGGTRDEPPHPVLLERRDGTLLETSLPLGGSVQDVLRSISSTLEQVGAYSLPALSSLEEHESVSWHGSLGASRRGSTSPHHDVPHAAASPPASAIDHRYDVRSRRGRDLRLFLSALSAEDVRDRRLDRTDAQAAALQVRREFGFQAVDATSLGWSSASVAVLLRRLLALRGEFADRLAVPSFYPTRLLFTSDEFRGALDVYGGVLRLNPAATTLQWLEDLRLVTAEALEEVRFYRNETVRLTKRAQGIYNVQFQKGYSCSSRDFYGFLRAVCSVEVEPTPDGEAASGASLVVAPLTATVESDAACRRALITEAGSVRLGAGMDGAAVRAAVARLSARAREQEDRHREERERCQEAIGRIQWELGVERVYKMRTVQGSEFIDCLARLMMAQEQKQNDLLKAGLTGNSLGVASSGAFCHLSDDGAVVIPVDWR